MFAEGFLTSYTPTGFITTEILTLNLQATNTTIAGLNGGKANTATIHTITFDVEAPDTKIYSGKIEIGARDTTEITSVLIRTKL